MNKLTQETIEARPKPFAGMRVYSKQCGRWITIYQEDVENGWDVYSEYLLPGEPGCPDDPQLAGYIPREGDEWLCLVWHNRGWHKYPKSIPFDNYKVVNTQRLFTLGGPNDIGNVHTARVCIFKVGDRVKVPHPYLCNTITYGEIVTVIIGSRSAQYYVNIDGLGTIEYKGIQLQLASDTTQKTPQILDYAALARQNNKNADACVHCGEGLEPVQGFSSTYWVCRKCEK